MKTTRTSETGNSALTASGAGASVNSSTTFVHDLPQSPVPHGRARVTIGGTFSSAALKVEGRGPSGALWVGVPMLDTSGVKSAGAASPSDSTNTTYLVDCAGFEKLRVYNASGTITSMAVEITSGEEDEFAAPLVNTVNNTGSTFSAGATYSGGTGTNVLSIPDNLASAWSVKESTNFYIEIITTNSSERVKFHKSLTLLDGITITNSANTTGTSLWGATDKGGFFGATPVVQRSAYTQTYSTADRTHANPTAATLTAADGAGTNDNTIGAITADASVIAAVQEIVDEINKLIADVADVKQVVNAIVDDFQALGVCA